MQNWMLPIKFQAFSKRSDTPLEKLRFLYNGAVLYAETEEHTLGYYEISENGIIDVLVHKHPIPHIAITQIQQKPDRIFEPVVKVSEQGVDRMNSRVSQKSTLCIRNMMCTYSYPFWILAADNIGWIKLPHSAIPR